MLSTTGGREAGRETGPQSGLNKAGVRGLCLHAHVDPPLDVDSPERGNDPGEYWQPQQLGDKSVGPGENPRSASQCLLPLDKGLYCGAVVYELEGTPKLDGGEDPKAGSVCKKRHRDLPSQAELIHKGYFSLPPPTPIPARLLGPLPTGDSLPAGYLQLITGNDR